jgi:hypothetical protein
MDSPEYDPTQFDEDYRTRLGTITTHSYRTGGWHQTERGRIAPVPAVWLRATAAVIPPPMGGAAGRRRAGGWTCRAGCAPRDQRGRGR